MSEKTMCKISSSDSFFSCLPELQIFIAKLLCNKVWLQINSAENDYFSIKSLICGFAFRHIFVHSFLDLPDF